MLFRSPNFEAETTLGKINFHEWLGDSWGIIFSHPADNTPVCTTELGTLAKYENEFLKRNTKVIGLSVDDVDSHLQWVNDIEEVNETVVKYPIIADKNREISTKYGMLGELDDTNTQPTMPLTVRCVFIIDPLKKIRLILVYPASCGRNFDEIIRVLDSLQLTTGKFLTTPANWTKGKDVIIAPSVSNEKAKELFGDFKTIKPYLRTTKDPSQN